MTRLKKKRNVFNHTDIYYKSVDSLKSVFFTKTLVNVYT